MEILQKLKSMLIHNLCDCFGVGFSMIYDIKKQLENLLNFYAESVMNKSITKYKIMHKAKSANLNKLQYIWFKQCRSEGVPISGPVLMEKGNQYHQDLEVSEPCEFSLGCLHKTKLCHGIHYLKMRCEKLSADKEATDKWISDFSKLVWDEKANSWTYL